MAQSTVNQTNHPLASQLGQAKSVVAWKIIEYIGLVLFIVVAPRAMGPDIFGSFASMLSLIGILAIASGMGVQAIFGRYVPKYKAEGSHEKIKILFTQLFCMRAVIALLLAMVYLYLFPRLLSGVSLRAALYGSASFFCMALGMVCYQFFYGMNFLGRWLTHNGLIKIVLLSILFAFGGIYDLTKAAEALFFSELFFLILGLYWVWPYFTWHISSTDFSALGSKLCFGSLFFVATLLLMVVTRGGEILLLLFSQPTEEVAYFNVANSIVLSISGMIGQFAIIVTPSITELHVMGDTKSVDHWVGYTLKYITIGSFLVIIMIFSLADWGVEVFIGEAFHATSSNLKIVALGILPLALVYAGTSLAVARAEPKKSVLVAFIAFVTFAISSACFIPAWASLGVSLSLLLALCCAAGMTCLIFPLGPVLATSMYCRLLFAGAATFVLILQLTLSPVFVMLYSVAAFIALLLVGKVLTATEMRRMIQVFTT